MTEIAPASDDAAASWLLRPEVDWQTLVRFGPPGFDEYARIALRQNGDRIDAVRAALVTLAAATATPERGYAAIWEGWVGGATPPRAPRVPIPERPMLLFTGPVETLRDAPALAWFGEVGGLAQEPHLVWPQDRSWCLACDVDEEVEFTVGCSTATFEALSAALPGPVRRARYGSTAA